MDFFVELDITLINIDNCKDIINDVTFLNYDLNYTLGYEQYKNVEIFALEYPKDDIEVGTGKVKNISENFEFEHNIDTELGSSGSPIILINTLKVIGIHKEGLKIIKMDEEPVNFGTFIGKIFNDRKLNINKNKIPSKNKLNQKKEIKAKA